MRSLRHPATYLAVAVLAAGAVVGPARGAATPGAAAHDSAVVAGFDEPNAIEIASTRGRHVLVARPGGGGLGCREATPVEVEAMTRREPGVGARVIKSERSSKLAGTGGLTIVLLATDQLHDKYPAAERSFVRAAETWEALVADPITIAIDVDFGPKRFGQPWDFGVIGSTDPQYSLTSPNSITLSSYDTVRSALIEHASNAGEASLYARLPAQSIPSDAGAASAIALPTSTRRALGLLPPAADPTFGNRPSIGFNNDFDYDFNPSDGVSAGSTDFDAVVVHELGHVLGFDSWVGLRDQDSSAPAILSTWDLFRFRPGTRLDTFASAQRILSSGGSQVYYAGGAEARLSTGGLDGESGDGHQASHWADDEDTGDYVGIMDPTIADGVREEITDIDRDAINFMGFRLATELPITVGGLAGDLSGNTLTITGTAQSTAGAITRAEVTLLDIDGNRVGDLPSTDLSIGTSGSFTLTFDDLDAEPAAVRASVVLFAGDTDHSAPAVADFSGYETGAPVVTKVKLKGSKLKLTGDGMSPSMTLEVNGEPVDLPSGSVVKPTGKKATIDISSVTLRSGANRIRFLLDGKHSNIVVLTRS